LYYTLSFYKAKAISRDNLGGNANHVLMGHRAVSNSRANFDCISDSTGKHYESELRDSNRVAVVLYSYYLVLTKVDVYIIVKAQRNCFLVSVPTKPAWFNVCYCVGVKLNPSWLRDKLDTDKVSCVGLLVDVNAS
jgi:hypothetical protein